MVVIKRERWSQKPTGPVTMSRHLPEGALMLWLFHEGGGLPRNYAGPHSHELDSGRDVGAFSGATWSYGARGPGTTFAAVADYCEIGHAADAPTTAVTVCLGWQKTDSTNRASSAFGYRGGVNDGRRIQSHLPYSDGVVYWDFGGDVSGTTRVSASGLTVTGYNSWAFTVGTGMAIWQARNGLAPVRVASNAATPTRTSGGNFPFNLNGAGIANNGDLAFGHWFFLHRLALPGELIREILTAPFGVLVEPHQQRRIFLPGGIAAGSGKPWTYYTRLRGAA